MCPRAADHTSDWFRKTSVVPDRVTAARIWPLWWLCTRNFDCYRKQKLNRDGRMPDYFVHIDGAPLKLSQFALRRAGGSFEEA